MYAFLEQANERVPSAEEIAKYIEKMDSDDGADILSDLDLEFRNSVIKYIKDKEKSSNLKDLIRYDGKKVND